MENESKLKCPKCQAEFFPVDLESETIETPRNIATRPGNNGEPLTAVFCINCPNVGDPESFVDNRGVLYLKIGDKDFFIGSQFISYAEYDDEAKFIRIHRTLNEKPLEASGLQAEIAHEKLIRAGVRIEPLKS